MKNCASCFLDKAEAEFNKNNRNKDGLQNYCRACSKLKWVQWYDKNRERRHKYREQSADRNVPMVRAYVDKVKSVPCADCRKSYPPYIMDFDHLPAFRKHMSISKLMSGRYPLSTIQAEIAKCEVVCANCHRIRTWSRAHAPELGPDMVGNGSNHSQESSMHA